MGLFGTNGVRGILGGGLTLADVHDITMAMAAHVGRGPVLVGRDGRDTSGPISLMVRSSLAYAGIDCADAGLVPTPCLQLAVRELGYAAGIMATASHNPPEYGGIKLVMADGIEASRGDEAAIERIHAARPWSASPPWGTESAEIRAREAYRAGISASVDVRAIAAAGLRIVLDIGNGAQATVAESVLSGMCDGVTCINAEVDAAFAGRGPEPRPDNLSGLSAAVRDSGADIGVAFDGDGDRSMVCDERGRVLSGDVSALLLADYLLSRSAGSEIVTPINSGDAIEEVAARTGSRVVRTGVGSVTVSREMARRGALAGFEENGGFMYGPHLPVRDGCMTAALALESLALSRRPLSAAVAALPESFTAKASVRCPAGAAGRALESVARAHPGADTRDGVKVRLGPRRWAMARQSGTEPIIRIYAESDSAAGLEALLAEYSREVADALAGGPGEGPPARQHF